MELSPEAVLHDVKECLTRGANSRRSAMHTPVLATADADQRVLVLRAFDPATMTLRFHTDARSPKVAAILADPAVSILAYDAEQKVQLRMRGLARVECTSEAAEQAWQQSSNFARRCYLAQLAPGTPSDGPLSGLPEWIEGVQPSDDQIAPARENFAIVLVRIVSCDWLYLAHSGHRRAQITFSDTGEADFRWVVP